MRLTSRFFAARRSGIPVFVAISIAVFVSLFANSAFGALTVGNNFVYANVEESSGLISIKVSPVSTNSPSLSFQDHSYLAVMIGSAVFTNNPNSGKPDFLTTTGNSVKVADTIFTTWTNLNGVDVIQKVYPVKFSKSGQIVISVSLHNTNGSPVACQAQFLLDTDVGGNDKSKILTRYNYTNSWTSYPGMTGIPWFFIGFQFDLPNSPSFNPGLSGQGYIDYPPLGLIVPDAVTVGDWSYLISKQWGAYNGTGPYGDSGILFEWPAVGVPANQTVEGARTSYGTGEFETCLGGLFGIFFYPHALTYDQKAKVYNPNPFLVDAYLFNTDPTSSATAISLKLDVGPLLTITGPVGNITNNGKTELLHAGSSLQPGGVAELLWTVKADLYKNCSIDTFSFLQFTSSSSITPQDFVKPAPCLLPIQIPCTIFDSLPPIVDARSSTSKFPYTEQANVHDDRATDDGLKSLTFSFIGADITKFTLTTNPTLVGPCDKGVHTVKVVQNDSTIGGCFNFVFTDCNANVSYDTMCFSPHVPILHPDVLAPKISLLKLIDQNGALACSAHCDSLVAVDSQQYDLGIKSITITPAIVPVNMGLNVGSFVPGASKVGFTVCMMDSTKNGSISVRATDLANNFTDTVITYCSSPDTNLPIVTVSALVGRTWHVTATEQKPWDSGLNDVFVTSITNVNVVPMPTNALTRGKSIFEFDVIVIDSTKIAGFCVNATDLVGHTTALNCQQYNPKTDIWCPNIVMTPPQSQNPNKVNIDVNDVHLNGVDTIGYDTGIDSVWLYSATPNRFIIPGGFPIHANFAHVVPTFSLAVRDTLNTDSVSCITIYANDKFCTTPLTWCYPYIQDTHPPALWSTATSYTSLSFHVADSLIYDRGLRQADLINSVNFQPFTMALNGSPTANLTLNVANPNQSAIGVLTVNDAWSAVSNSPANQLAHTSFVSVSSWVQNFGFKRSYLYHADSLPASGQVVIPVKFVSTDTFALVRKAINEYQFSFKIVGDPQITFKGADVTGSASAGWTVTSNTIGGLTTIFAEHGKMGSLSDSTLPLINLMFGAVKDEVTRSALVQIVADPLGSIIYNAGRDSNVTGQNATASLPPPHGSINGTNIVIVGLCAPALTVNGLPTVAGLDRNYPNPFSSRTTLGYQVPAEGMVTLVVYDAMGKEVSRLVSSVMKQGSYEAIFDASAIGPGFYIARYETAGKIISRALVVQR
jgi:hypothetical protein